MEEAEDQFVRMRKLIARRHMSTTKAIKTLSAKYLKTPHQELLEEQLRKEGEKRGLCFALTVLDRACQLEAPFA